MQKYLYNLVTDKYNRGFIPSIIKALFLILSFIYGLIIKILIFFFRLKPYRLNCRVISVGNITLGGTGKTSLVEYIARYLKQQGYKVAILSRGYKRKVTISPAHQVSNSQTMGDEPYMLAKELSDIAVIVDTNRIRAAKRAMGDYSVDTVILDDGFQQWRIRKDLEIIAIDATNPFGNRHLLPRGILRETLSSLKRADMFVLTKTNLNPDIQEIKTFLAKTNPQADIFEAIHQPVAFYNTGKPNELLNTEVFKGETVTLFSGIGDPDSFENLIRSLEVNIGLSFRFRDHHNYNKEDLDRIIKNSKDKNIDTIITTEKDAARFCGLRIADYRLQIFVLRIKLKITKNEEGFHNRLLRLYFL